MLMRSLDCGTTDLGHHSEVASDAATSADMAGSSRYPGGDRGYHRGLHVAGQAGASRTASSLFEGATCWSYGSTRSTPSDAKVVRTTKPAIHKLRRLYDGRAGAKICREEVVAVKTHEEVWCYEAEGLHAH